MAAYDEQDDCFGTMFRNIKPGELKPVEE